MLYTLFSRWQTYGFLHVANHLPMTMNGATMCTSGSSASGTASVRKRGSFVATFTAPPCPPPTPPSKTKDATGNRSRGRRPRRGRESGRVRVSGRGWCKGPRQSVENLCIHLLNSLLSGQISVTNIIIHFC